MEFIGSCGEVIITREDIAKMDRCEPLRLPEGTRSIITQAGLDYHQNLTPGTPAEEEAWARFRSLDREEGTS